MTTKCWGIFGRLNAPVDETTRSSSIWTPGTMLGVEPVAITMCRAAICCSAPDSPRTTIRPGPSRRPWPSSLVILCLPNRKSMPRPNSSTTPSLCASSLGGDAAHVQAGASKPRAVLHASDSHPELRSAYGRLVTARAAADDHYVEFTHPLLLFPLFCIRE